MYIFSSSATNLSEIMIFSCAQVRILRKTEIQHWLRMWSSLVRMWSSLVVRASDRQCTSCNGPGFDPSIRWHSGIWGAADEAVLNIVQKNKKIPAKKIFKKNYKIFLRLHEACFLMQVGCETSWMLDNLPSPKKLLYWARIFKTNPGLVSLEGANTPN